MALNITQSEVNALWDKGYRPFEIYLCNDKPELYCGEVVEAGKITGWDIANVFATRDEIENYPNFDCIIACNSVSCCDEVFHGNEVVASKDKRIDPNVEGILNLYMETIKLLKEANEMPDSDRQKANYIMLRTREKANIVKELKKLIAA